MNKLYVLLAAVILAVSVNTKADNVSITIEGGYTDTLFDHGVARLEDSWFTKLSLSSLAANNPIPVDVYGSGTWAPDQNGGSSARWNAGIGRGLWLDQDRKWGLRLDLEGSSQQTSLPNLRDTAQVTGGAALVTPILTPYATYTADWSTEQNGFQFGVTRSFELPYKFVLSPDVSYFMFEDYSAFQASAKVTWKYFQRVSPYLQITYNDNDFDVVNYDWAAFEASGTTSFVAGVSYTF
jgi:hypothetical protein